MEYYKSFIVEAKELSAMLPAEQNELYKRYLTSVPIEKLSDILLGTDCGLDEERELLNYAGKIHKSFGVKFDLIIGSTKIIVNNHLFAKIVDIRDMTEEYFQRKMHRSNDDKIIAFIHAHSKNIIVIDVPDGCKANLNILFANCNMPLMSQVTIKTGIGSELNLFEWCGTSGCDMELSFSGIMHELDIGKRSTAEINIIRNENVKSYVSGFSKGRVAEDAHLAVNYVYNGGASTRVKNDFVAAGYSAEVDIVEIAIGSAEQKFDIGTVVVNAFRNTVTDLESRAVMAGGSACLLKGFAHIQEKASGARSFVNERGIMLDKNAHIDSIPGMSINNKDVKASHSSATTPVDEEALFYLMSRGASEQNAKKLLIIGFFTSSISKIHVPFVKEIVSSLVQDKVDTGIFGEIPEARMTNIWDVSDAGTSIFRENYKMKSG